MKRLSAFFWKKESGAKKTGIGAHPEPLENLQRSAPLPMGNNAAEKESGAKKTSVGAHPEPLEKLQ